MSDPQPINHLLKFPVRFIGRINQHQTAFFLWRQKRLEAAIPVLPLDNHLPIAVKFSLQ